MESQQQEGSTGGVVGRKVAEVECFSPVMISCVGTGTREVSWAQLGFWFSQTREGQGAVGVCKTDGDGKAG